MNFQDTLAFEDLYGDPPRFIAPVSTGQQLRDAVFARAERRFAENQKCRMEIHDLSTLELRRQLVRRTFLESIGGLPDSDCALAPEVTGVVTTECFRLEKILFFVRQGVRVSANLYLPHGLHSPGAAVLFVCGHHAMAKSADEYQIVIQTLVRAGLIVFALDPVGQGERAGYWDPGVARYRIPPCVA